MTNQEVWDFFKDGRGKKKRLKELKKQLQQLESSETYLKAIDYEKPTVSGGTLSDLSATIIREEEAKANFKKEIAETQADIYEWQRKAYAMLRFCKSDLQAGVIAARFIHEQSWEEVQSEYCYSRRRLYDICREAMAQIASEYKE